MIGAGGVHLPPDGYIEGVADLCAEHGILLVIDSVICAFGRLGTWFGVERWPDVTPGPDHVRQGRDQRLPAARRRDRRRRGRRAVLRRARRPDAAPRRDLRRPPDVRGGGARRARRLRGGGPDPARAASSRSRCARRSRRSPTTPRSARCAPGSACSARSQLSDDALAADPGARRQARGGRARGRRARAAAAAAASPSRRRCDRGVRSSASWPTRSGRAWTASAPSHRGRPGRGGVLDPAGAQRAGGMFWLTRNRLSGSYCGLDLREPVVVVAVAGPHAVLPSSIIMFT